MSDATRSEGFDHTVRVSSRAKHVRLTVTAREGLVVVVPRGMEGFDPQPLLEERRAWIAEALEHFGPRLAMLAGDARERLPAEVRFAATHECWPVEYRASGSASVRVREAGERLVVSGATHDAERCEVALRRWLQRAGRERLLPLLAEEASRVGVRFASATVRGQRARWGGCSPAGAITLNRALLFLQPELCRAALLHELAHVREPNHSAAFHAHLATLDPRAERHAREIAASWDALPLWAEP